MTRVTFKEIVIFHAVVLVIMGIGYLIYEQTRSILVIGISCILYIVWGVIIGIRIEIENRRKKDMIKNPYKYIKPSDASKERIFKHIQKTQLPGLNEEMQGKLREMVFEELDKKYENDKK